MKSIINKNLIVEEYEFTTPHIQKIDSIYDNCIRDFHLNYFHTFDDVCASDNNLTNDGKNEIINLTISDKNMILYELNEKLKIVRENGFIFNQIIKVKMKIYSNLSHLNTH